MTRTQENVKEYGSLESTVHGRVVDEEKECLETFASNSNVTIDKTLIEFVPPLTQAHAMSDLCKVTVTKSRNVATLLAAKLPPLPNDFGRGGILISFRMMAYVQANIFLSAPCQTPKDELFQ